MPRGDLVIFSCALCSPGDCGIPPEMPNSQHNLKGVNRSPEGTIVTYKCDPGFVKLPGLPDSLHCENGQWSQLQVFCKRKT